MPIASMTTEHIRARDLPPTAVRLSPEIRHALAREASINGRSLHGEIVHRLKNSVLQEQPTEGGGVREPRAAYGQEALTDGDRAMLTIFKRMSPEKQLALLSLLK